MSQEFTVQMPNFTFIKSIFVTIIIAILSYIFSLVSYLPAFPIAHWTFRICDYLRIQLLAIQVILFGVNVYLFDSENYYILFSLVLLGITISYQAIIIIPYLPTHNIFQKKDASRDSISILSVNVLQSNTSYEKLIALVNKIQPDILLTLETNKAWEKALEAIEPHFSFTHKVPKENRYGIHFYTKFKVESAQTHYFISEERPAIEIQLYDTNGNDFVFLGIHPPPPSPTEKPTSKQKEAEFMKVAKLVRSLKSPSIVTGDFNNVCWSKSAKLFAKVADLEDSRIGKGIHGTFPVRPFFMRFPIDLLFTSKEIKVHKIKTLADIGSDHLPFYAEFSMVTSSFAKADELSPELDKKAAKIIDSGLEALEEEE
ncbi:endonuclease/exonuclease/phosphatase (EEP) superfamily protein YafD [Kordia periserrulae]|uniref:Endonuclease/exonuclease/phosphatase (EEP) superfamily protein YafD n=1 Tax=Kordia periserrulae TaxID=701523 RepID=A0A2T6BZA6_9FLAO|nr:endonuclease/exonuclease/phosphatase family protein [Kordia periserrulae]PTX61402.1 endonuclease/exonuclease/phosphatase (EEP) superfamily protein YafD [Kordia periserrulae]